MIYIFPYIGFFLTLLALLNSFMLVCAQSFLIRFDKAFQSFVIFSSKIQFPILFLSFICLIISFITDDFSLAYVSSNSNSALPFYYKISAAWAGHEGSMLLWCLILSFWMFLVSVFSTSLDNKFRLKFLSIMGFLNLGFLMFLVFTSNPFEKNVSIPIDGNDLNPLLQDFGLIVHPPMLYMGYIGLSVVFSFALTCCLEKEFKPEWAKWIRPWALTAWSFLTLGIALGSWWAYYELGWGGWWFWDPVENASFMPWLMSTALIHSLSVCEKKEIFKNWTILLALFSFSLSLLGMFLVRSGILISVHSFANDPARGIFILIFLTLVIGGALTIYFINSVKIKDKDNYKIISQDTLLLINNILLVTATFTILLGTMYPLILDVIGLEKISVGTPYFNHVFIPIMIPLVILMGFIPLTKYSGKNILQINLVRLLISAVIIFIVSMILFNKFSLNNFNSFIGIFMFFWIIFNIIFISIKNIFILNNPIKLLSNMGMYFAHIGLAIFILGATIVENNKIEKELVMKIGDKVTVGDYIFKFNDIKEFKGKNYDALIGNFVVTKNNVFITNLSSEKRIYLSSENPMTEAGIFPGLSRDLYVSLGTMVNTDKWSIRIYYKPLIRLIWLGALIMMLGGFLSIFIKRKINYRYE